MPLDQVGVIKGTIRQALGLTQTWYRSGSSVSVVAQRCLMRFSVVAAVERFHFARQKGSATVSTNAPNVIPE